MGKFLPGKIPRGKNSATIVKIDGKNCATLFHGEGQGLRSALLIEGEKVVQQNVDVFIQVLSCSCLCRTATYREHSVS